MPGDDRGKKGPPQRPHDDSSFGSAPAALERPYVPQPRTAQPAAPAPKPAAAPAVPPRALARPLPARPGLRPGMRPGLPGALQKLRPPPPRNAAKSKAAREEAVAAEERKIAEKAAVFRGEMEKTGFAGQSRELQTKTLLGTVERVREEEEVDTSGIDFNGEDPAPEVTSRDIWKALTPPLQSREGRRDGDLYRRAIDQFGVGKNPRYAPDEDGKSRAHIFIWDLSRAMHAEVPHFVGIKELSLAQTCDWIRYEGGGRGWLKCDLNRAFEAVAAGMPVLALPKELKLKAVGVVRPDDRTPDGKPVLAAAGAVRGPRLTLKEALGVFAVEYYFHA